MVNESKIKELIQEYLSQEGLLKENLTDPKLEFGFKFVFPPVPMGKIMFVIKPKNKNIIIITIGTQISEPHVNALNALENSKKLQFFLDLRKFFLLKDVYFRIDLEENRYEISEQMFVEKEGTITKNNFYNSVRKVFNCDAYSNIILEEYCSGKVKPESFIKTKELSSGSSEFSLYS
jgi:hypothetical protein